MNDRRTYQWGLKDRLRIAREQANLSQAQLAKRAEISRGSVSNYEQGNTTPRRPEILAWAEATGFDPEWLATGKSQRALILA